MLICFASKKLPAHDDTRRACTDKCGPTGKGNGEKDTSGTSGYRRLSHVADFDPSTGPPFTLVYNHRAVARVKGYHDDLFRHTPAAMTKFLLVKTTLRRRPEKRGEAA